MIRSLLASLLVVSVFSSAASAQVVIRALSTDSAGGEPIEAFSFGGLESIGPGMMMGFGGMPQDPLGMLQMQQYADELTILDDQRSELRALQQEIRKIQSESFKKFRQPGGRIDFSSYRAELEETQKIIKEKTEKGLSKILLPAQRERLEEIQTQMALRSGGVNALSQNRLAEILGLTDEQKKKLTESQGEYQAKLKQGIEALRAKLQKEILGDVLSAQQMDKLEKIQGAKFTAKQTSFRDRIEALRKEAEEKRAKQEKTP